MVRPLHIHPWRDPAPLRQAATLLLLRDGAGGLEVLMTRRSERASFVPGAYVFPGGTVEAGDASTHGLARLRPQQSASQATAALAALRECYEELGLLLGYDAHHRPLCAADVATLQRDAPLLPQCEARGWTLAVDALFELARWTTDRDLAKRFEVPFLVAHAPHDQQPVADEREQFEPVWISPTDALARHAQGTFFMIFPTVRTLQFLQRYGDAQAVLDACAQAHAPFWDSCPRAGWRSGEQARFMEHELEFAELALVCPDGQIRHTLDWQHEQPVPLLRHVQRLTAPNPGRMTGPGTNSYLVGEAATGYVVIDPGPADSEHLQRLLDATQGDIRAIVCTHSHPDHAPGARPLQAMVRASGRPAPAVLGLPSGAQSRPDSVFTPDRTLQECEHLTLAAPASQADSTHTLEVWACPGHASNHLVLRLCEDGLLFSGDHVLSGSTTVIDPPDGDMHAYLQALTTLRQRCAEHAVAFILPAHGHVLGGSVEAVQGELARLHRHRLQREAKVLRAVQVNPKAGLDGWLPEVYDDVPTGLWPVARRSLLAHALRLQTLGQWPPRASAVTPRS